MKLPHPFIFTLLLFCLTQCSAISLMAQTEPESSAYEFQIESRKDSSVKFRINPGTGVNIHIKQDQNVHRGGYFEGANEDSIVVSGRAYAVDDLDFVTCRKHILARTGTGIAVVSGSIGIIAGGVLFLEDSFGTFRNPDVANFIWIFCPFIIVVMIPVFLIGLGILIASARTFNFKKHWKPKTVRKPVS
jgi:hypothetical protein